MAELTRREVQQIVDNCRKQILDRMLERQDIVRINEEVRNRLMNYTQDLLQVYDQKSTRRSDTQITDLTKRVASLETKLVTIEQDTKTMIQLLQEIAERQTDKVGVVMPDEQVDYTGGRYAYPANSGRTA